MTPNKAGNPKLSDHPAIGFVGFIASLIGIIMFLTGRQQIADFVSPMAIASGPTSFTPTAPLALTPTSTSLPAPAKEVGQTPAMIPTLTPGPRLVTIPYPGLTVEVKDYTGRQISDIGAEVIVYAFAGKNPIDPDSMRINCTTSDGTGTRTEGDCIRGYNFWTYDDGSFKAYPEEEGYWSIHYQDNAQITIDCYPDTDFPYPLVPVGPGKSTEATLQFGVLQVEVLASNGKAEKSASVELARAETMSGKDGAETHKACNSSGARRTNQQGIARFVVVEGTYAVRLQGDHKNKNGDWQDNLFVGAGQEVLVVIGK